MRSIYHMLARCLYNLKMERRKQDDIRSLSYDDPDVRRVFDQMVATFQRGRFIETIKWFRHWAWLVQQAPELPNETSRGYFRLEKPPKKKLYCYTYLGKLKTRE